MADKLKVVLAGCGGMSNVWIRETNEIDGIEFVGLVDINEDTAKQRKEDYNLATAITGTDIEQVLSATNPDIVFDCTTPESHYNVTLTALKHSCHILGEKPLADSMDNARKMVEAAVKSGKIYAVIQNRRYYPQIHAMQEFIKSGKIGDLTTLNSDFYIGAHFGGFRDRMEHVLLLDMAIHTLDSARLISGADPVAVYCQEWNPKGSWYDHDASAIAIFEMSDGIIYTYRGSWCSEGMNTTWESNWRAIGTKGSVVWDGMDNFQAQAVAKNEGFVNEMENLEVTIPETDKRDGHNGLIKEFIHCVRTGGTPETICTDNIKSIAMVFAAIESAEAGKRVEIKI